MKTLKQYLTENKKVYSFKIKIAGELPESFQESVKKIFEKYQIVSLEKISTPIQEIPLDFPELTNKEVTIFNMVLEYPITAPEITNYIKDLGVGENCLRVRGSSEPTEYEEKLLSGDEKQGALLNDPFYTEAGKVDHKDYFGPDFNKSFLQELLAASKERSKELGHDDADPDVLGSAEKIKKQDMGIKSAIGS